VRLKDIVNQLGLILPKYTDRFSTLISITSINASGGVATIVTDDVHGLVTGNAVTLSNVNTRTPIDAVSQDGLMFTFETSSDHDLTFGWFDQVTVALEGFTDGDWNDSFTLLDVQNRETFKVRSTNSLPSLNGNEKLLENRIDGVNGRYSVTVIDTTTFTITGTFNDGVYTGGTVSGNVRVAGTVDVERAIQEYTKQETNDLWMFVGMHDVETSKNREALSDAIATPTTGEDIRLRLIDGFTLFICVNVSDEIAGAVAVDVVRDELLSPILNSVFGVKFNNNLSASPDFRSVPKGHGLISYDRAVLVYAYEFEVSMDIVEADAVAPLDTRAFRDVDYTHELGTDDTDDAEVTIPLDDEIIVT